MEPQEDFITLSRRMGMLPPYLFASINKLKDKKRREGIDVIDMSMGNPTDPTPKPIVEKLCEVVNDARNHRYSAASGIYNLRREVMAKPSRRVGACPGDAAERYATRFVRTVACLDKIFNRTPDGMD